MADEIIPILRVADALETASWYERLGFENVGEHRFGVEVGEQPWGREVELVDPDGNRLRIATRTAD